MFQLKAIQASVHHGGERMTNRAVYLLWPGRMATQWEGKEGWVLHHWAFSFFLYPIWASTYIWMALLTFKTNLIPLVNPLRNTFTDTQQCALPISSVLFNQIKLTRLIIMDKGDDSADKGVCHQTW